MCWFRGERHLSEARHLAAIYWPFDSNINMQCCCNNDVVLNTWKTDILEKVCWVYIESTRLPTARTRYNYRAESCILPQFCVIWRSFKASREVPSVNINLNPVLCQGRTKS